MKCLDSRAVSRNTVSAQVNALSSRFYAIFTLHVKQQWVVQINLEDRHSEGQEEDYFLSKVIKKSSSMSDFETLNAKFHFVDVAVSEQLKRTGVHG